MIYTQPVLSQMDIEQYSSPKKSSKIGSSQKSNKSNGDRFIPSRVNSNINQMLIDEEDEINTDKQNIRSEQIQRNYSKLLQSQILGHNFNQQNNENFFVGNNQAQQKLFKFNSDKKYKENANVINNAFQLNPINLGQKFNNVQDTKSHRKIAKQPFKILDAPTLQDDFYLNLLDWSSDNQIAIGLEDEVYTWSASNNKVQQLCEFSNDNDMVCSVSWAQRGTHLAVGNNFGQIHIYDANKQKLLRTFQGHSGRVGSLAWNGYLLASGSRDRNILVRDVRQPELVSKYEGHKQEICGLKWSFDEQMLASGGNDNKLFVWSLKNQGELTRFQEHTAAVKAIGWNPHRHNVLASGGGTADRTIRFWDTQTLQLMDCIDTGSQVCNLMFSQNSDEIVSTHGYSLNQICVWKYPGMQKIATLTGHTYRVLYLAMSPCGKNVVTGAGDETLRFWNLFPALQKKNSFGTCTLQPSNMDLR